MCARYCETVTLGIYQDLSMPYTKIKSRYPKYLYIYIY